MAIYNFLINPSDGVYQRWWPVVHLELHNLRCIPRNLGNIVYMDEYVGKRRLRWESIATEAEPSRKITWQIKKIISMPAWLRLELEDDQQGVTVTHTIRAGFEGVGKMLDVIFRIYLLDSFAKAMEEHARNEYPKLGDLLPAANLLR